MTKICVFFFLFFSKTTWKTLKIYSVEPYEMSIFDICPNICPTIFGDKKVTYCQFYMIQTIANGILKYLLKNGSEIMMGRWKNSKGVRHCPRHKG